MKEKPSHPRPAGPKPDVLSRKPARLEREAQALRANLLRRKAQDRARKPSDDR
ncbi:MAG: hypothetical protein J2P47_09745 [Acetobacteraceae bacterium]|nr:hypothetical protein [Acetobacteraceae bacterium]